MITHDVAPATEPPVCPGNSPTIIPTILYLISKSPTPKMTISTEPPIPQATTSTDEDSTRPPAKWSPEFWRRSFSYMTGMGMTDEDHAQLERDSEARKIEEECRKCEKQRDYLMKYSIQFTSSYLPRRKEWLLTCW